MSDRPSSGMRKSLPALSPPTSLQQRSRPEEGGGPSKALRPARWPQVGRPLVLWLDQFGHPSSYPKILAHLPSIRCSISKPFAVSVTQTVSANPASVRRIAIGSPLNDSHPESTIARTRTAECQPSAYTNHTFRKQFLLRQPEISCGLRHPRLRRWVTLVVQARLMQSPNNQMAKNPSAPNPAHSTLWPNSCFRKFCSYLIV